MRSALVTGYLALAVAVSMILAPPASTEPPPGKGSAAVETKSTGAPTDPDAWGTAASTFGQRGIMGTHSSSFTEPRLGVGNVAANDGGQGTRPSDHAFVVGPMAGVDPTAKPGK